MAIAILDKRPNVVGQLRQVNVKSLTVTTSDTWYVPGIKRIIGFRIAKQDANFQGLRPTILGNRITTGSQSGIHHGTIIGI